MEGFWFENGKFCIESDRLIKAFLVEMAQNLEPIVESPEPVDEDYYDEDDYGICNDCRELPAVRRFVHLHNGEFYLCEACFGGADHESDYGEDFYYSDDETEELTPEQQLSYAFLTALGAASIAERQQREAEYNETQEEDPVNNQFIEPEE